MKKQFVMADYRLSSNQPFSRFLFDAADPRLGSTARKICTGHFCRATKTFTTTGDQPSQWVVFGDRSMRLV